MSYGEIPNGSLETDSVSDGVPDDWERGLYPGGEGGYDSGETAHGARSYRFVHPGGRGNGGGYLESGFFPANRLFFPPVRFACKASAAGTVWFDAVGVEGFPAPVPLVETVDQPAAKTRSAKYIDVGRAWDMNIPAGGKLSWLVVEVELMGSSWTDETGPGSCRPRGRLRIGERWSSDAVGPDASEWGGPYRLSLNIDGLSGTQQLRFQLRAEPGGEGPVSLRSPASLRSYFLPNTRIVDVGAGTVSDGWEGMREGRP